MIAKALEVDFSLFTEDDSTEDEDFKTDSDRNWLAMLHLSGMLPLFFPTMLMRNQKKSGIKGMADHYRAVIAFQSSILFGCLLGGWVYFWAHEPIVIIIFLVLGVFFSIKNTLKVLNGKPYKYFGMCKYRGE